MAGPTITLGVTDIIAGYAALISTATAYYQWKTSVPRIEVTLAMSLLTGQSGTSPWMVSLSAGNKGQLPVTVASMGIHLPNGKKLLFPYPQSNLTFPYRLEPGEGCDIFIDLSDIVEALDEEGYVGKTPLRGFYRDQAGREYASGVYVFDMDEESAYRPTRLERLRMRTRFSLTWMCW